MRHLVWVGALPAGGVQTGVREIVHGDRSQTACDRGRHQEADEHEHSSASRLHLRGLPESKSRDQQTRRCTPCMAAGVIDRLWSVEGLSKPRMANRKQAVILAIAALFSAALLAALVQTLFFPSSFFGALVGGAISGLGGTAAIVIL